MSPIPHPSPNHDPRPAGTPVDMLVLHYTGMPSGTEALARLCDAAAKVSSHYVVFEDGRVFQLVDEGRRAWHAGVSSWRGRSDINARSIGIEIVNPGHEHGYRDFPRPQMEAVATLCLDILARHPIPPRNVVAHSDIAPARKEDPGERFDWASLAARGIGLWPGDGFVFPEQAAGPDSDSRRLKALRRDLAAYGYGVEETGGYTPALKQVIIAFQRHFRPQRLDGVWDGECAGRLAALLGFL